MPYTTVNEERFYFSKWDARPDKLRPDDSVPPLVLVHGAGGTHLHWPPRLRRLKQVDVYGLDLPGHGHSNGNGRESISSYADCVANWAEAARVHRFVLAGHSMGGAIAIDFALRHADLLAGLVLVGSGARLRVHPGILSGVLDDFASTAKQITEWAIGPMASEKQRSLYLRALLDVDPAVLLADFTACNGFDMLADSPAEDRLAQIAVPTLVVCGAEDRLTPPKYSRYLQERIDGAELLLVPEAGHMVMLEQPQAVTRAIREFVAGLSIAREVAAFDGCLTERRSGI